MTAIKPKVNIPGYRIIRKIGEGGMSVVYLAFQESLKREVALKIMRPIITDEENVIRRFEHEAQTIAKLYHPNIVSIYEVGHIDDDILYYSMPYLQHGDLTSFAYHKDDELKVVLAGICDGMAYAHSQGVVHRDMKPENILFDQFGQVQMADFGIALSTGHKRYTRENRIVGSIHYMSPEQAQSKKVDARSDIYGLGAILYEILTGLPVYDEDDDLAIMMAHVNDDLPQLPPAVAHWQVVINKSLAKSPSHRYQDMSRMKAAILAVKVEKKPLDKYFFWSVGAMSLLIFGVLAWSFGPKILSKFTAQNDVAVQGVGSNTAASLEPPNTKAPINRVVVSQLSTAQVDELLTQSQQNIDRKQLTTPPDNNALDQLLLILSNVPDHPVALGLLSEVMAGYYDLVYQALLKNDFMQAEEFADSVAAVRHKTILTDEHLLHYLEENIQFERSLLLGELAGKVKSAKTNANSAQAKRLIALIDDVMPGHEIIEELNSVINDMPKSGQIIKDKKGLRSVVVLPESAHGKGLVSYALAVTETEISWQLFDQFVLAAGHEISRCKTETGSNLIFSQRNYAKPGFKTFADSPVACVTWQDANLFIAWYNQQTGEKYRLPTDLEWRHLIKLSGIKQPDCGAENLAGTEIRAEEDFKTQSCNDQYAYVAPFTAFNTNSLGLIGFHGNVAEWLAGCQELGKFKAIFNPEDQCESNPSAGFSWLSGVNDNGGVKQIKFDQAWSHIGFRLVKKT